MGLELHKETSSEMQFWLQAAKTRIQVYTNLVHSLFVAYIYLHSHYLKSVFRSSEMVCFFLKITVMLAVLHFYVVVVWGCRMLYHNFIAEVSTFY